MRLSPQQIEGIRLSASQCAGASARIWLFGSRVHDERRGGDVDLLLDLDEPVDQPARLAAQVAARVSRLMHGRKVDVLIKAPNLAQLPIHQIALAEGVRL